MDTNGVWHTYCIVLALTRWFSLWAADSDTGRNKNALYIETKTPWHNSLTEKKKHKLQKHTGSEVCAPAGEQIWLEAGERVRRGRGSALVYKVTRRQARQRSQSTAIHALLFNRKTSIEGSNCWLHENCLRLEKCPHSNRQVFYNRLFLIFSIREQMS